MTSTAEPKTRPAISLDQAFSRALRATKGVQLTFEPNSIRKKLRSAPTRLRDLKTRAMGATPPLRRQAKPKPAWFRGEHTNFNPVADRLMSASGVRAHVVGAWAPLKPLITPDTKLVAFGSCFAQHITDWLAARHFSILTAEGGDSSNAHIVKFNDAMVNTFAIRGQFEWGFEGKQPSGEIWHDSKGGATGARARQQKATNRIMASGDVYIITLGLSEVWYDHITGGVFWRAVPLNRYDPDRHLFRVSTVAENRDNIIAIHDLIQRHRPGARVIFSLSPIPLLATFRPTPCITANSASKAILRAALDEALRKMDAPDTAFYWPSYEIVLDVFENVWMPDRRHVKREVLDFIMRLFEAVWCGNVE